MPIDPNIILGAVQPPQPQQFDPMATLGRVMQIRSAQQQMRENDLQIQQRERQMREEEATQRIFGKYAQPNGTVDWDSALDELSAIAPVKAVELRTKLDAGRKETAQTTSATLDQHKKSLDQATQLLRGSMSDPAIYMSIRPRVVELAETVKPGLGQMVPEAYDPQRVGALIDMGSTQAETVARLGHAAKLAQEALEKSQGEADLNKRLAELDKQLTESMGIAYGETKSQEDWDAITKGYQELGAPKVTLLKFGSQFSPEAIARARVFAKPTTDHALQQAEFTVGGRRDVKGFMDPDRGYLYADQTPVMDRDLRPYRRADRGADEGPKPASQPQKAAADRSLKSELNRAQGVFNKSLASLRELVEAEDFTRQTQGQTRRTAEERTARTQELRTEYEQALEDSRLDSVNHYRTQIGLEPVETLPPEFKIRPPATPTRPRPVAPVQPMSSRQPSSTRTPAPSAPSLPQPETVVNTRRGRMYVTAVNPDGTFEAIPEAQARQMGLIR